VRHGVLFLEDSWPVEEVEEGPVVNFLPDRSANPRRRPAPLDLRPSTRARGRRFSFRRLPSSWCLPRSSGPSNWYYYRLERPSHYVINVTRVDYRSLFRTCLHCPRTMLDPLPPPPPCASYAEKEEDGTELTPRFNLRDIGIALFPRRR